jgi:ORF6N domain
MIRGQKVMIDKDLSELYGVGTKVLKQTVRRYIERFPEVGVELAIYPWYLQNSKDEEDFMERRRIGFKLLQD